MPSVHIAVGAPWADGATIHASAPSIPWTDGATVHAGMSGYTPGSPPVGGSTTSPTAASVFEIAARQTYDAVHDCSLTDLRDDSTIDVFDLAIATDEDSVFWTLRASGAGSLYAKLTTGEQPAQIEAVIDGLVWRFAVDTVSRSREFGTDNVSFTGRSLTVAASSPYEVDSNWVNDGDTTAAQTAAIANIYTGLEVVWRLDDWIIPNQIFSFSGTPLGVVRRLAEAVGAVVASDRSEYRVTVSPRYPSLPNEWPVSPVDVQIAWEAVQAEAFERADRPEYDGVYVSGQQGGVVGFVRLAGCAGATPHPLVTDLLLTEAPALRQRGMAILGASGGQARVSLTLPVLTGAGEPGVLELNQLVRVLDPAGTWVGLVRSVSVSVADVATDPRVRQVVVLERHTKLLSGTYVPVGGSPVADPLVFSGTIVDQTATVGVAFSLDLSGYWSGGTTPYTWSMRSGTLPAGLTLNATTGVISGTPTTGGTVSGLAFRAVDAEAQMADSNTLEVDVGTSGGYPRDTFTGGDTTLASRVPEVGGSWVLGSSWSSDPLSEGLVTGGAAHAAAVSGERWYFLNGAAPGSGDCYAEIEMLAPSSAGITGSPVAGLLLTDDPNDDFANFVGVVAYREPSDNSWWTGGTGYADHTHATTGVTYATDAAKVLRVELSAGRTTVRVYFNGALASERTGVPALGAFHVGVDLGNWSATTRSLDILRVETGTL